MKDEAQLQELLAKSVPEITAELPSLDRQELSALLALEDAGQQRVTLTKAIAAAIEKRDNDDAAAQQEADAQRQREAEAAAGAAAKADVEKRGKDHFTHPDYRGPLTCDQADWRNRNLKPAQVEKTK